MRGKEIGFRCFAIIQGITPAYAGKRDFRKLPELMH